MFGPYGNFYVSSRFRAVIGRNRHITFGPDDNLYVAAENSAAVMRYDGHTGASINAFASRPGMIPKGLLFLDAEVGGKVMCDGLVATIVGGNEDDVLIGTDGNDVICGDAGNDELSRGKGQDVPIGGPGVNKRLLRDERGASAVKAPDRR